MKIEDDKSWKELQDMALGKDPKLIKYIKSTGGSPMLWKDVFLDTYNCSDVGVEGFLQSLLFKLM